MKKLLILRTFIATAVLSLALQGCGKEAPLSERLPNRMVPRKHTVYDSLHSASTNTHATSAGSLAIPETFRLTSTAKRLGSMSESEYLALQQKWVGSTIGACNFFLITALCEAGYCSKAKPFYKAAQFDQYFAATGWNQISLPELKSRAARGEPMDVVFQKSGADEDTPGHVMIFLASDPEEETVTVAQGDLNRTSHEIGNVTEWEILNWDGGYRIFVRE